MIHFCRITPVLYNRQLNQLTAISWLLNEVYEKMKFQCKVDIKALI